MPEPGTSAALLAAGLVTGAFGATLKGNAAEIQRKNINALAGFQGLDLDAIGRDATAANLANFGQASELAGKTSTANQANLNAARESALPGSGAAQELDLNRIMEFLRGDVPDSIRHGAAQGLGRFGAGGSQAMGIGTLRLTDQERTDKIKTGAGMLQGLLGSLRIAQSPGVQAFFGLDAGQRLNALGQQQAQRLAFQAEAARIKGKTGIWGDWASGFGGALTGAGLGGLTGGMGGMGGGAGGGAGRGGGAFGWGNIGGGSNGGGGGGGGRPLGVTWDGANGFGQVYGY